VPAAPVHTHQAAAPAFPVRCRHQQGHTHNGRRREAAQRVGSGKGRRRSRPPVGPTLGAQATQGHTVHVDQREYLPIRSYKKHIKVIHTNNIWQIKIKYIICNDVMVNLTV